MDEPFGALDMDTRKNMQVLLPERSPRLGAGVSGLDSPGLA